MELKKHLRPRPGGPQGLEEVVASRRLCGCLWGKLVVKELAVVVQPAESECVQKGKREPESTVGPRGG